MGRKQQKRDEHRLPPEAPSPHVPMLAARRIDAIITCNSHHHVTGGDKGKEMERKAKGLEDGSIQSEESRNPQLPSFPNLITFVIMSTLWGTCPPPIGSHYRAEEITLVVGLLTFVLPANSFVDPLRKETRNRSPCGSGQSPHVSLTTYARSFPIACHALHDWHVCPDTWCSTLRRCNGCTDRRIGDIRTCNWRPC